MDPLRLGKYEREGGEERERERERECEHRLHPNILLLVGVHCLLLLHVLELTVLEYVCVAKLERFEIIYTCTRVGAHVMHMRL